MPGLTPQQIDQISQFLKQEHGDVDEDFSPILKRTFTVGMLKKALEGVDESLPVELEIALDISEDGVCTTQPGFAIHTYTVAEKGDGSGKLAIVGALPDNVDDYVEAFELDRPHLS